MNEFKDFQHFLSPKIRIFWPFGSSNWKLLNENYASFKHLATLSIATTSLKKCWSNVTSSDNVWELCWTTLKGWDAANNCDILFLTDSALFCFSSSETNKQIWRKKTRQSKHCGFSIYMFEYSKSKSMVRLVRAEKMVLSGLVSARKIARMILIQNI